MHDVIGNSLDQFRSEVLINVGLGLFDLDIVDAAGQHPVIAALEEESLAALMRRVANIGGYANVFVRGKSRVRIVDVLPTSNAIFEHQSNDMTVEPPHGSATVGAFLDYLETQEFGVKLPSLLPATAPSTIEKPRAVEFAVSSN